MRMADTREKEKKHEEISKGKQQIIESNRRLLRLKAKSDADVTSVSVSGDDRENQRRIADEQRRQELRSKLLSEAESSARQNAAVAMRWADLFSIEVRGCGTAQTLASWHGNTSLRCRSRDCSGVYG